MFETGKHLFPSGRSIQAFIICLFFLFSFLYCPGDLNKGTLEITYEELAKLYDALQKLSMWLFKI